MVQGLAGELTRFIDGDIAGRLARDEITPTQARALNELSRFTGSALRAAANPNDPMYAFAQDYLAQLLGPGGAGTTGSGGTDGSGTRVTGTVFDDDGNLMPGVLNTQATPAEQQRQLQSRLETQGYSSDDASRVVRAFFHPEQVSSYLDQHDWTPDSSQVMSAAQELLARFPDMLAADALFHEHVA
jgi:hypothetical protein